MLDKSEPTWCVMKTGKAALHVTAQSLTGSVSTIVNHLTIMTSMSESFS